MTARKWVFLFGSTFVIGGLAGLIFGMAWYIFQTGEEVSGGNLWMALLFYLGLGWMFSILSHMGFFAYLFINRTALGVLKSPRVWRWFQVILIVVWAVDMVWLRMHADAAGAGEWARYALLPLALLALGAGVATANGKISGWSAWIPTLFFMTVITTIEWLPALMLNNPNAMWLMLVPLWLCNTWQVLILHRLVQKQPA